MMFCIKKQLHSLLSVFTLIVVSVSFANAFEDDGSWKRNQFYAFSGLTHHPDYQYPTFTQACEAVKGVVVWGYSWGKYTRICSDVYKNFGVKGFIGNYSCGSKNSLASDSKSACYRAPAPVISKQKGKGACSVGNPISVSSGNKYQAENLIQGPLPLQLFYNSSDQRWLHTYSYYLTVSDDVAKLVRPDGKGFTFTRSGSDWIIDDADVFYRLVALDIQNDVVWKVITPAGDTELYDTQGRLLSITDLHGMVLSFVHTRGQTLVKDSFANVLTLNFGIGGVLQTVKLNDSLLASLSFDTDGRLLKRTDAANQTTTYHYEDTNFPKHLTGITGPDGVRFATWAYDDQGRGILREHAGQERATLVFNDDDSTTVTNSLGKQTTYHFELIQGLKRPVAIEGHATENCVAANKAYTYNANGLVETQTDWRGNVTRLEYNGRGLVTKQVEAEGKAEQREVLTKWHTELPLLLQQTKARLTSVYSYDEHNRIVNMAKN